MGSGTIGYVIKGKIRYGIVGTLSKYFPGSRSNTIFSVTQTVSSWLLYALGVVRPSWD